MKKTRHHVEVQGDSCQARFVAWYAKDESAKTETLSLKKCGFCGGNPFKRDNPKDCILRLMVRATAQNAKRVDQEN